MCSVSLDWAAAMDSRPPPQIPAELSNLMQEDPAIAVKRRQLQDLSGRLEKAVKVLQHPTRRESITGPEGN